MFSQVISKAWRRSSTNLMMMSRRLSLKFCFVLLCLSWCLFTWKMNIISFNTSSTSHHYENFNRNIVNILNSKNIIYTYPVDELDSSDYKTLMNLRDFHFDLINECTSMPILLVVIHTSPYHFYRRKCIRETWGQKRENLQIAFMLGSVRNPKLQITLEKENRKFKDLIQGNFLDVRINLTYKYAMAFKYSINHCPGAKYVLKTNDNIFVNMPAMMNLLTVTLSPYGARKLLMCQRGWPIRKWDVFPEELDYNFYPPFCQGWGVLYSPDVLFTLYRAVQESNYSPLDYALITGILTKQEHIQQTSLKFQMLSEIDVEEIASESISYNITNTFLFGPPHLSVDKMYLLWDFVKAEKNLK